MRYVTVILALLLTLSGIGQNEKVESLKATINSNVHDTVKLDATIDLCGIYAKSEPEVAIKYADDLIKQASDLKEYSRLGKGYQLKGVIRKYQGDFQTAIEFYNKGIEAFKKDKNVQGQALCLNNIGVVYKNLGQLDTAIVLYDHAEKMFLSINDSDGIGKVVMNKGVVLKHKGEYEGAINLYMEALRISEATNNKKSIAKCCNNLSSLYRKQGLYDEAKKMIERSLQIAKEEGSMQEVALSYSNLGTLYSVGYKDQETALNFFDKSLKIYTDLDNKKGMAGSQISKAYIYQERGELDKALEMYEECLEIYVEIGFYVGMLDAYMSCGEVYAKKGDFKKGIEYIKKALQMAEDAGEVADMVSAHNKLAFAYRNQGNYKSAFEHYRRFHTINDSISGIESKKQIMELQAMFENEQKEKEIEVQKAELEKRDAELAEKDARQNAMNWIVGLSLLVVIGVVAGWITNRNKNRKLAAQNEEILFKNILIETKNRDIMDSIQYAKRLQDAILPPADFVSTALGDAFVLYKPKDVVSGDFFWVEKRDTKVMVGVIDCTGHGVPGAFMSIVGHNGLHQAFAENDLTRPSAILDHLNKTVSATLRQNQESEQQVRDGMDAALCCIDRQAGKLEFAGAMNPIFLVRSGELKVIKGDKKPIGSHEADMQFLYSNHEIDIHSGDCLYLFSDGFQDQFGGKLDKKFKIKRFKELLVNNYMESMEQQLQILEARFEEWRGDLEQIDDVCVIGVRV